jgi:hypothetical protein
MMSLDIPAKTVTAIEKIIRGFLWKGRKDVRGVTVWWRGTKFVPQKYGGLGIPNLRYEHCFEGQVDVASTSRQTLL